VQARRVVIQRQVSRWESRLLAAQVSLEPLRRRAAEVERALRGRSSPAARLVGVTRL
jgi:hypothetical protein